MATACRALLLAGLWVVPASAEVAAGAVAPSAAGDVLYNGIRLPSEWPPRLPSPTEKPMPVPYLAARPDVAPIDVGRQLFVDDFLVEKTDLTRTFHRPEYHEGNPVVRPEKAWEKQGKAPFAAVFSDGVWYDPSERLFKMWYMASIFAGTAYATSRNGLEWEKPALEAVEQGTNLVDRRRRDSSTVWLDWAEKDPQRRWKMATATVRDGRRGWFLLVQGSPDGVRWKELAESSPIGDRSTIFYNPFRKVWVYGIRSGGPRGRQRQYREHPDLVAGATWRGEERYEWVASDGLDPRNPNPDFKNLAAQLYNLDAVAYESVMLGLFAVWQGPNNSDCAKRGIQKRNEVLLGFSRDGFHWHRPDRERFLEVTETEGSWRWGNVQSCGGGCLVVGDRLYFYFSGRALTKGFWDGAASTGLAMLRRDGFCSMDAGAKEGTLTTRPVTFRGKRLFVNVDCDGGSLAAEVLDSGGKVIEPFTRGNCSPISADKTLQAVTWKGAEDLAAVSGKPVRFRFHLTKGSLYAFWVSPDGSGASHGYVAAGGPGFTGATDTVGRAAYEAAKVLSAK